MKERLNVFERAILATSMVLHERQQGYRIPFSGELLRTLGWKRMIEFSKLSAPIMAEAVRVFGERDTQVLCSMCALWAGCPFCSVGHMLAANLLHLRETGALFPIPEPRLREWRRLRDSEVTADARKLLGEKEATLAARIERSLAVHQSPIEPEDPEGKALVSLVALWSLLTECSVHFEVPVEQIPPLATVAKDKALRAKYAALRSQQA